MAHWMLCCMFMTAVAVYETSREIAPTLSLPILDESRRGRLPCFAAYKKLKWLELALAVFHLRAPRPGGQAAWSARVLHGREPARENCRQAPRRPLAGCPSIISIHQNYVVPADELPAGI
eukprot:4148331-Pleurochrysis_carterae.AAC.1